MAGQPACPCVNASSFRCQGHCRGHRFAGMPRRADEGNREVGFGLFLSRRARPKSRTEPQETSVTSAGEQGLSGSPAALALHLVSPKVLSQPHVSVSVGRGGHRGEKLLPAGCTVSHHFTGLRSHRSREEGPGKGSVLALHLITPTRTL